MRAEDKGAKIENFPTKGIVIPAFLKFYICFFFTNAELKTLKSIKSIQGFPAVGNCRPQENAAVTVTSLKQILLKS